MARGRVLLNICAFLTCSFIVQMICTMSLCSVLPIICAFSVLLIYCAMICTMSLCSVLLIICAFSSLLIYCADDLYHEEPQRLR